MSALFKPRFPPVERADDDGLLCFGGSLRPPWLLAAYRRGIFPWPLYDGRKMVLAWFSPDPRCVLEFDQFHASRRLLRRIRNGGTKVTLNQDFAGVIRGCARPENELPSWITPDLMDQYIAMHELGHAHSVEVWREDRLVGGVYGVALGAYFSGESMFHRETDASKIALYYLVQHLQNRGYELFDVQAWTGHTGRLGASQIPRPVFLERLRSALERKVQFCESRSSEVVILSPPSSC